MLAEWFAAQLDYILLWHGLGLLLLALPCRRLAARERCTSPELARQWQWLAAFAVAWGVRQWLDLPQLGHVRLMSWRAALDLLALVSLFECARGGKRQLGAGSTLVTLALCGLATWHGDDRLINLALGGPAAMWAAWSLSRRPEQGRFLAGSLAIYGLIVALCAITAGNRCAGVCCAASAVSALTLMSAGWTLWRRGLGSEITVLGRRATLALTLAALATVLLGWVNTGWQSRQADQAVRAALHQRAVSLARAIHPPRLQALSFTAADAESVEFLRLGEQLRAYHRYLGDARGYYTVAPRGRDLVFGPESYAPADASASPPGTVYKEPSPLLQAAVGGRRAVTLGPYRDEYGEYLSAFAPVLESRSGNVIAMVGVDVDAAEWRARLSQARLTGLWTTLLLALSVVLGLLLLHLRAETGDGGGYWLRRAELVATASVGCALTVVLGLGFHQHEVVSSTQSFELLAEATAESVITKCEEIRTRLLVTSRLMERSGQADAAEFERFVQPFTSGTSPVWAYAPRRGARLAVELAAPAAATRGWLGRDLLADPVQRQTVERALATGLLCGAPEKSVGGRAGYLAYQAVPAGAAGRATGMVTCRLAPLDLVEQVQRHGQSGAQDIKATLLDLSSAGQGATLDLPSDRASGRPRPRLAFPVNLLGRAWVVLVEPTDDDILGHPYRVTLILVLICLGSTAMVSRFVATLRTRQAELEVVVGERTAALAQREEALRVDLQRALAQQQVLAEMAMLPTVLCGDLAGTARICTERAASVLGTARASVWTIHGDRGEVELLDAFDADLGSHSAGQVLPMDQVEPLLEAARTVRVFATGVDSSRYVSGAAREHVERQQLSAMLVTLVRVAGEDRAALLISHRGSDHPWSPDELTFCSQIADQLSLAMTNRERLEAQAVLDQSKREVEQILQSLQTCVLVVDAQTHTILEANPSACKLIGTPREQLIGLLCHERVCPKLLGQCPITDEGGSIDNAERIVLTSDGRQVPVLKTVVRLRLRDRDCLLESFVDITAQREQQEQLGEALAESERMIGLMMDREDRIIEMKREVNDLLSRLGQEPRYASVLADGNAEVSL